MYLKSFFDIDKVHEAYQHLTEQEQICLKSGMSVRFNETFRWAFVSDNLIIYNLYSTEKTWM